MSPGAPPAEPVPSRPIEAEMVRMGLMTPDEVAATMREESETGRPFIELAVERGHVSAENMAKIAKPVLPSVQRAPSETQPAPPERRAPLFEQSIPAQVETQPAPLMAEPPPAPPMAEPPPAPPVVEATPAPPVLAAEPAPIVEAPAPVVEAPAPIHEAPPPIAEAPAPVVEPARPIVEAPPPVVEPTRPIIEAAQPVAEAAPVPLLEPEPIAEPEPVVEAFHVPAPQPPPVIEPVEAAAPPPPAAAPVQAAQIRAEVFIRLSNGERVAAGTFAAENGAEQCAQELMAAIDTPGGWPRVDGRYVRPDAIVSIDIDLNRS